MKKKTLKEIFKMNPEEFQKYLKEREPEFLAYMEKEKERQRRSHDSPSWYRPIGMI